MTERGSDLRERVRANYAEAATTLAVLSGEALLAPTVTRRLIAEIVGRSAPAATPRRAEPTPAERLAGLIPRETDTLRALAWSGIHRRVLLTFQHPHH